MTQQRFTLALDTDARPMKQGAEVGEKSMTSLADSVLMADKRVEDFQREIRSMRQALQNTRNSLSESQRLTDRYGRGLTKARQEIASLSKGQAELKDRLAEANREIARQNQLLRQRPRTPGGPGGGGGGGVLAGGGGRGGRATNLVGRLGTGVPGFGVIAGGSAGVGLGLVAAARGSISIIGEFEEKIAELGAVSQASGTDLNFLRDQSLDLGRTTRFTAREVADSQTFLARAGFSVSQALAATPATLDLATAGYLGLGEAADIASNTLTQFGLAASQTQEVSDVLVNTANSSNTSIRQAAEGLKLFGPIAGSLGESVADAAAQIGVLGDAGIQASLAGTNLRGIFTTLLGPSRAAQAAIQGLGLSLDELNPSSNSTVQILNTLAEANLDAESATAIFQKRNAAAALALTRNIDSVNRLAEANRNAEGAARDVSRALDDTLRGSFRSFNSAVEGLVNARATGLVQDLRETVELATQAARLLGGFGEDGDLGDVLGAASRRLTTPGILGSIGASIFGPDVDQAQQSRENQDELNKTFLESRTALEAFGAAQKAVQEAKLTQTVIDDERAYKALVSSIDDASEATQRLARLRSEQRRRGDNSSASAVEDLLTSNGVDFSSAVNVADRGFSNEAVGVFDRLREASQRSLVAISEQVKEEDKLGTNRAELKKFTDSLIASEEKRLLALTQTSEEQAKSAARESILSRSLAGNEESTQRLISAVEDRISATFKAQRAIEDQEEAEEKLQRAKREQATQDERDARMRDRKIDRIDREITSVSRLSEELEIGDDVSRALTKALVLEESASLKASVATDEHRKSIAELVKELEFLKAATDEINRPEFSGNARFPSAATFLGSAVQNGQSLLDRAATEEGEKAQRQLADANRDAARAFEEETQSLAAFNAALKIANGNTAEANVIARASIELSGLDASERDRLVQSRLAELNVQRAAEEAAEKALQAGELRRAQIEDTANLIDGSLQSLIFTTDSFGDALKNLALTLSSQSLTAGIRGVFNLFGSGIDGGTDNAGGFLSSIFSAKGNVFSNDNVQFFRRGGLINEPTLLGSVGNRAAIGGEAGPEIVAPADRDSAGTLGLRFVDSDIQGAMVRAFERVLSNANFGGGETNIVYQTNSFGGGERANQRSPRQIKSATQQALRDRKS